MATLVEPPPWAMGTPPNRRVSCLRNSSLNKGVDTPMSSSQAGKSSGGSWATRDGCNWPRQDIVLHHLAHDECCFGGLGSTQSGSYSHTLISLTLSVNSF